MKTTRAAIVSSLLLCSLACDDRPSDPPVPAAAPAAAVTAAPAQPAAPEYKPEYTIAIEESATEPKQYAVTWSAKVNTGGWSMKTESVLVEEHMGAMAARIYVTLEQPNPSDMTTQSIQTITGKHDAGTTKIERVEFPVRRHVRGVKYDTPALYSVVKSIRYPY